MRCVCVSYGAIELRVWEDGEDNRGWPFIWEAGWLAQRIISCCSNWFSDTPPTDTGPRLQSPQDGVSEPGVHVCVYVEGWRMSSWPFLHSERSERSRPVVKAWQHGQTAPVNCGRSHHKGSALLWMSLWSLGRECVECVCVGASSFKFTGGFTELRVNNWSMREVSFFFKTQK